MLRIKLIFLLINIYCVYLTISELQSICPIYLTISTLSRHTEDSQLIINWGPNCQHPPEWIGIYNVDPSVTTELPIYDIDTKLQSSGRIKSTIKLGKIQLPNGWNHDKYANEMPMKDGPKCLPFYIASYIGTKLLTLDCLKIQPNWMSLMQHLANIPLKNLFIPGTHCSGCYHNRSNVRSLILRKFGVTQNFDIWTQLVFGVRYLDISIGYHENKNHNDLRNFWIINESIFVAPLINVLQDIKRFIILSGEIVIMDFAEFPIGFYNRLDRHLELIKLLEIELGDVVFRRNMSETNVHHSYDLTMDTIRKTGKTLLITYNQPDSVSENNLIWSSWRKYSTFGVNSTDISEYLRKIFTKKYPESPSDIGWILEGVQGIGSTFHSIQKLPTSRERADTLNKNITLWLGSTWSLNTNIVTVDFILSSYIIDIAIYVNQHKTFGNNSLISFDIDRR